MKVFKSTASSVVEIFDKYPQLLITNDLNVQPKKLFYLFSRKFKVLRYEDNKAGFQIVSGHFSL